MKLSYYRNSAGQGGGILVIAPIISLVLLGFVGIVLDLGIVYLTRSRLQRALDASTMVGTMLLRHDSDGTQESLEWVISEAEKTLNINLSIEGLELDPLSEPQFTIGGGVNPTFTISATASTKTYLSRLVGGSSFLGTVSASATGATRALAVSIAIDQSSSMCDEFVPDATSSNCPRMVAARAAMSDLLGTLNESIDYVGLTSYGTFAAGLPPARFADPLTYPGIPAVALPMSADHFTHTAAQEAVDSLQVLPDTPLAEPRGWTNIEMGIKSAAQQFSHLTEEQQNEVVKVLLLMTDGNPSTSGDSTDLDGDNLEHTDNAILASDEIRGQGVIVMTIGLGPLLTPESRSDPYQVVGSDTSVRGNILRRLANDPSGSVSQGRADPEFATVNPAIPRFSDLAALGHPRGRFYNAGDEDELAGTFKQIVRAFSTILKQ
jgi:von Willebrand factor type A domain/Putative Flp pilus-assembly TadE/G-like